MVIKMDRAYVICHMAVSLDGKIDGDFHEAEKGEKAGAYYRLWRWSQRLPRKNIWHT